MTSKINILILLLSFKTIISYQCDSEATFNTKNRSKLGKYYYFFQDYTLADLFYYGQFKGQGSFGRVHQIPYDGKHIAAKEIQIKKTNPSTFNREIKMMQREINFLEKLGTGDKKEFFPQFYGCTLDVTNESDGPGKYMVLQETLETDFKKPATCIKFLNKFTPIERIKKYRDLAMGLVKMHSLNISHEDLKPENIMTNDKNFSNFKIIDMGMVCSTSEQVIGGSPLFNSPEKISNRNARCNPKHDIWALGLTIASIEGNMDYIFSGITESCFRDKFEKYYCYNKLLRNVETVLNMVFGRNNIFSKLVISMISFNCSERPTAQNIVDDIDSMTNQEKANDLMISKQKHDFKASEGVLVPDIQTLNMIEARDVEVTNIYKRRYQQRNAEKDERMKQKKIYLDGIQKELAKYNEQKNKKNVMADIIKINKKPQLKIHNNQLFQNRNDLPNNLKYNNKDVFDFQRKLIHNNNNKPGLLKPAYQKPFNIINAPYEEPILKKRTFNQLDNTPYEQPIEKKRAFNLNNVPNQQPMFKKRPFNQLDNSLYEQDILKKRKFDFNQSPYDPFIDQPVKRKKLNPGFNFNRGYNANAFNPNFII